MSLKKFFDVRKCQFRTRKDTFGNSDTFNFSVCKNYVTRNKKKEKTAG